MATENSTMESGAAQLTGTPIATSAATSCCSCSMETEEDVCLGVEMVVASSPYPLL